jgi:hypothetical protein
MSVAECVDKFMYCSSFAAKPLPKNDLDAFIDKVQNLEKIVDAGELMQYLH